MLDPAPSRPFGPALCKAAAERLVLHKNTVRYRIRKAEESLGRTAGENRHDVELALQVSYWLGAAALHPGTASAAAARRARRRIPDESLR